MRWVKPVWERPHSREGVDRETQASGPAELTGTSLHRDGRLLEGDKRSRARRVAPHPMPPKQESLPLVSVRH